MSDTHQTAATERKWSIELTSDGGFSGRGNGGLTINGDDVVAHKGNTDCPMVLSDAETKTLHERLAAIHPEAWAASYAPAKHPNGHPDQFHYDLTVSAGDGKSYKTGWYGESAEDDTLPPDLGHLREFLMSLQQRARADCHS
jgi:hypothetical protein